MKKHVLQTKIKSVSTAYLAWFFGFQYIYLGKIGIQILYWFTFGGIGVWTFIDLLTLSSRVKKRNAIIYSEIDDIEKQEKENDQARNIAMIKAVSK